MAGSSLALRALVLIAVFLAAMAMSFGLVTIAYSATGPRLVVLALAAVTGLAARVRLQPAVSRSRPLLAVCLGGAILFNSVPAVPSVRETLLALAGTDARRNRR